MLAANFNITLDRAADYSLALTVNNLNGNAVSLLTANFYGDIRVAKTKVPVASFTFKKNTTFTDAQIGIYTPTGTAKLVVVPSTANLSVGMSVTGTHIAAGTTIASILGGTQFVLSQAATQSGSHELVTTRLLTLADGMVLITLPAYLTKQLREGIEYEYDIFKQQDGTTSRLLEGLLSVRNNRTNEV